MYVTIYWAIQQGDLDFQAENFEQHMDSNPVVASKGAKVSDFGGKIDIHVYSLHNWWGTGTWGEWVGYRNLGGVCVV